METWLSSLPPEAQTAALAFSDPHPPGARARALYAATALYEVARAWPSDQPGLEEALRELTERLLAVGQGTAHQPGVRNMTRYMLSGDLSGPSEDVAALLLSRLGEGRRSVATASEVMSATGAALLRDGDRVLVHDFADRSTQAVITAAAKQGKRTEFVWRRRRSRSGIGRRSLPTLVSHGSWVTMASRRRSSVPTR